MFSLKLHNATHVRRFLISDAGALGWEVREELDSEVIRRAQYSDWHRVERARYAFEREMLTLREDGWVEG